MKNNIVQAERSQLAQVTEAEIDVMVATANRYPRDLDQFEKDAITAACATQETALSMTYSLPARKAGDKPITGKSVRLAELCVGLYRNLRVQVRAQEPNQTDRLVSAQAGAMDLERNSAVVVEKHRRITKSDGTRYNDDMVAMTMAAASAIAYREAVFKIIDPIRMDRIYRAVQSSQLGDPAKIAQIAQAALKFFTSEAVGLTEQEMLKLVDKKLLTDLTLEDLRTLNGFKVAIDKEGTLTPQTLRDTARGVIPALDLSDLSDAEVASTNDAKVEPKAKAPKGAK